MTAFVSHIAIFPDINNKRRPCVSYRFGQKNQRSFHSPSFHEKFRKYFTQELSHASSTGPLGLSASSEIDSIFSGEREISPQELDAIENLKAQENNVPKYMPSLHPEDPIVSALMLQCKCTQVTNFELLDSRWNGNETMRYDTDKGSFFIKMNRVEHPSVMMSEAIGLTTIFHSNTFAVPRPYHVGELPKIGDYGPGCFMILEWFKLIPFGSNRPEVQKVMGKTLAKMHLDTSLEKVHKNKFGFMVNNYHALTPLDNTWTDSWPEFFKRRLSSQLQKLHQDKPYARAPLQSHDMVISKLGDVLLAKVDSFFEEIMVRPSLIHGDLWIGNSGATPDLRPVVFDPACFFGHHEMELAIMKMYGGFESAFWDAYHELIPKAQGYSEREKLYMLYNYLNHLNLFGEQGAKDSCEQLLRELVGDV